MQMASLAVTTVGMLIYAGQDINFNAVGYLWLVGNSFATISNTFWNKVFITKYTKDLKIHEGLPGAVQSDDSIFSI